MATHKKSITIDAPADARQARHRWAGCVLSLALLWLCVAPVEARDVEQKAQIARVEALLAKARKATDALHDYQGVFLKRERFGDEVVEQTIGFKFSRPFKVYLRFIEPHEGREGIYVRGWSAPAFSKCFT